MRKKQHTPKKRTAARERELDQLINDLAEDMPLKRWTRGDLLECVDYQQDTLCRLACESAKARSDAIALLAQASVALSEPASLKPATWQQRVWHEKSELDKKAAALSDFLNDRTKTAPLPAQDLNLLYEQRRIMAVYSDVLGRRIVEVSHE